MHSSASASLVLGLSLDHCAWANKVGFQCWVIRKTPKEQDSSEREDTLDLNFESKVPKGHSNRDEEQQDTVREEDTEIHG